MAAIKSLEQSSTKWAARAAVAGDDYRKGVESPRVPWDVAASAADGNYRAAVNAAAAGGRYMAGVRRAGNDAWRRGATMKGPARFSEGVQLAQDDWQKAFAPYQQAIAGVTLPARGPTGSPANLNRVSAITTALRAAKDRSGSSR
jgi:hypothetical protein